jgi:hypothetical protein
LKLKAMMHGSAQWVLTKLHRQNSGLIAGRCCNFARPCQKAFLRLEIKQRSTADCRAKGELIGLPADCEPSRGRRTRSSTGI